ncbi:YjaG family protein [Pseudaeromonas sp. ZJS20]|uniref:YjaG family protein n=1 Tax=Pseudaeromonas aegiceratis TaxID=3153928 RepID=UPI00390C64BF
MFGEKFYKRLDKFQPWQQTLFALALAERMYPNYVLYAETSGKGDGQAFRAALDALWQYLTQKSSRVDLGAILEQFEEQVPDPRLEDHYGAYPALDACVALGAAYNSVICRIGEEAQEASHASVGSVAGFIELMEEQELEEEALYAHPLMEAELEFQVELLNRVGNPRDAEQILVLKEWAGQGGVSNLGISLE